MACAFLVLFRFCNVSSTDMYAPFHEFSHYVDESLDAMNQSWKCFLAFKFSVPIKRTGHGETAEKCQKFARGQPPVRMSPMIRYPPSGYFHPDTCVNHENRSSRDCPLKRIFQIALSVIDSYRRYFLIFPSDPFISGHERYEMYSHTTAISAFPFSLITAYRYY